MIETKNPEINVDELMKRIRAEVAGRREYKESNGLLLHHAQKTSPLQLTNLIFQASFKPKFDNNNHISELLKYHHEKFVKNAYLTILHRNPDSSGLENYLRLLDGGKVSKIEILGRLRYSPEGRRVGSKIRSLAIPFVAHLVFKVPLLGYIIRLITAVLRLPRVLQNIRQFENYIFSLCENIRNHLNHVSNEIENGFNTLTETVLSESRNLEGLRQSLESVNQGLAERDNRITGLEELVNQGLVVWDNWISEFQESMNQGLAERDNRIAGLEESMNQGLAERDNRIAGLEESMNQGLAERDNRITGLEESMNQSLAERDNLIEGLEKPISYLKTSLVLQERRLSILLEEARKRLPEPFDQEQLQTVVNEKIHLLDPLYVSFEDEFRGTREDIKDRLKVYLPLVQEANAGTEQRPILDIGCGRGEWLELLQEEGLQARGLDINRILVEQCRDRGMDIIKGDIIEYLRSLPNASLGTVTAFHLIEHLSFKSLMKLLDETVRVLKPGGLAIFETPNPENIIVGACNFYFDPTHRNPLPPAMMKFLAESRGLCRVEIKRLHPYDEVFRIKDDGSDLAKRFNDFFYGPQDYAVLGYRI